MTDLKDTIRRQAEEEYPDRALPGSAWNYDNQQLHFHNERVSFIAGRTKPMELLVEAAELLKQARGFVRADGLNDRGLSHSIDATLTRINDLLK